MLLALVEIDLLLDLLRVWRNVGFLSLLLLSLVLLGLKILQVAPHILDLLLILQDSVGEILTWLSLICSTSGNCHGSVDS